MKVIDLTIDDDPPREAQPVLDRVKQSLKIQPPSHPDLKAQQAVIAQLNRMVDSSYVLLREVKLPDLDFAIPLILIGPPGVLVIDVSSLKGVYRARADSWEVMDKKGRDYVHAHINMVERGLLMAQAAEVFLVDKGWLVPDLQAVLILTNPGLHLEQNRPSIRIVLADGLNRFMASFIQSPPLLNQRQIQEVSGLFASTQESIESVDLRLEIDDQITNTKYRGLQVNTQPLKQSLNSAVTSLSTRASPVLSSLRLEPRQWAILAAIAAVDLLLLIAFFMFIILTI